ncbi:MAG TPA: alpha/beta hydrolase-fold protein [Bacteroidia bacterium]
MRTLFIFLFTAGLLQAQSPNRNKKETNNDKPIILGISRELRSEILSEKRTLNIYLPEGYNAKDTSRYPVVYLLDGRTDEDFIHVVGLYQFNSFPWIDRVPRSIIVGIVNVDRKRDFTFPTTVTADQKQFPTAGHSEKFMDFIEKELQPYIDKTYKTSSSKTLIGESLGGLFASEVILKRPALFNRYIIISPSIWWDNGSLLKFEPGSKYPSVPTDIYIGVGKEGLAPGENPHVMEVDANLLAEKLKNLWSKKLSVHFDYLPQETHSTISHQAIFNALRELYPAK